MMKPSKGIGMESLAQLFYEEANEMLEQMEQILLTMEESGADPEVVNALFRHAHSLKGNSGAMGFTHISRFTHGLENALDGLRKGSQSLTKPMTDLLLEGVDVIRRLLDSTMQEGDVGDPRCKEIVENLTALMSGEQVETVSAAPVAPAASAVVEEAEEISEPSNLETAEKCYRVSYIPSHSLDQDNDPLRALLDLKEYVQILSVTFDEQVPLLSELHADVCYVSWTLDVQTGFDPTIVRAVLELTGEGATVEIEPLEAVSTAEPEVVEAPAPKPKSQKKAKAEPVVEESAPVVEQAVEQTTQPETVAPAIQPAASAPPSPETPAPVAQTAAKKSAESQTIRVSTEKVDALFNLVSEIVIAQSMLSNTQSRIQDEEVRMAVTQMERHVRELHESVMAVRMIPVGYVFNRFPRMIRDLASSQKKEIHLVISGEETELDRTLLESLSDPLTHLIRNSVDHGIEPPEERKAKGKPAHGTIRLNAYQAEGRIYIEVQDDGRGLDSERIRQKAIKLGWIREEDHVAPEQLFEFIFKPGFSTAEQVSDLSGRGVGMDVVLRNVESLGGMVAVSSEPGKKTCVTLKVPLTLAILDGLNLRVGQEYFIVPLTSVIETFRPNDVQISSAFGTKEIVNIRGKFVPLLKLHEMFQVDAQYKDTKKGLLVVLEQEQQQIVVLVDQIVGQSQVVMKSLDTNFVRVPGFSGATILGDGHVALILDVGDMLRRAQNLSGALMSSVA